MPSLLQQTVRVVTASLLATVMAIPPNLMAEAHVLSRRELQAEVLASGQTREHNLEILARLCNTSAAEKAMKVAGTDVRQIQTAMATLDDRELAQLATRAQKAQADFAAGHLTDRDLLVILIAIVALVLIVVAVRR